MLHRYDKLIAINIDLTGAQGIFLQYSGDSLSPPPVACAHRRGVAAAPGGAVGGVTPCAATMAPAQEATA